MKEIELPTPEELREPRAFRRRRFVLYSPVLQAIHRSRNARRPIDGLMRILLRARGGPAWQGY
jgi:hypothetical protein